MMTQPTLSPQEFVTKWRKAELKERSAAQEHVIDLCRLLEHPTPAEADPEGKRFTFEAGTTKQRGGQGWADVWKKGFFAWEYKGKHADQRNSRLRFPCNPSPSQGSLTRLSGTIDRST